jgi:coenzyme Q-binding protein COQ10
VAEHYQTSITLPYDADALCGLVADVRAYPRFLPWVKAIRVWDEAEAGEVLEFQAEAAIGYKMVSERFATGVIHDRARRTVTTTLLRGPFRTLENTWTFTPLASGGANVQFDILYAFKGALLQALLQANFDKAVRALIGAFTAEADRRFGGQTRLHETAERRLSGAGRTRPAPAAR